MEKLYNGCNLTGILDVSMLNNLVAFYPDGCLDCIQVNQDQLDKLDAGELPDWNNPYNVPYSLNCN